LTLWIALITAAALIGAVLLAAGFRGKRIDDHPVCRRCRFDLAGLSIGAPDARCPECGRDLTSRRALRIGRRRRRRGAVAAGTAALMIALVLGGGLAWTAASGFNWNTIKPVWLLRIEAESANLDDAGAALEELANRAEKDALSSATLEALAVRGLEIQDESPRPWIPFWGDLIEAAAERGAISEKSLVQYVKTAVRSGLSIDVRDPVRLGDPWPLSVRISQPRAAKRSSLMVFIQLIEMSIDGVGAGPLESGGGIGLSGGGSLRHIIPPGEMDVEPGRRRLGAVIELRIQEGYNQSSAIARWREMREAEFEALVQDAVAVELVRDESIREAMIDSIEARQLEARSRDGASRAYGFIYFRDTPMPAAFDISWRAGDREWPVGSAASNGGGGVRGVGFAGEIEGFDADRVDVILRPSRDAALETLDLRRIWDGEIVIEDIPVRRESNP